jgi:uncharacterized protein YpmS
MKYQIKYAVNPPSKTFEINELEEKFFYILYSKLSDEVNKNIILVRLSNGSLNVECKGFCIGKIKLQGKKHFMQILDSLYKFHEINENFEEHIDEWILYINKYILKELK